MSNENETLEAKMTDNQIRALRLVDCGTRMRLTHRGTVMVSNAANFLLGAGLIRYAPEKWIAYEPTPKGLAFLRANPRDY